MEDPCPDLSDAALVEEDALHEDILFESTYSKALHIRFGCVECPADGVERARLQKDLLNTYYWSGGFCTDYCFFVANWHPLLGIFLCHPSHPWTRGERILLLLVSFSLMFATLSLGCEEHLSAKLLLLSLVVTVFEVAYTFVLYNMSVLDTYCISPSAGYIDGCICKSLRCCWRLGKWFALCQATLFACGIFVVCMTFIENEGCSTKKVAMQFAVSRAQSYLIWFPLYLFLPCIGFIPIWRNERKKADRQAAAVAASVGMSVADSTGERLMTSAESAELSRSRLGPGASPSAYCPPQRAVTEPVLPQPRGLR